MSGLALAIAAYLLMSCMVGRIAWFAYLTWKAIRR